MSTMDSTLDLYLAKKDGPNYLYVDKQQQIRLDSSGTFKGRLVRYITSSLGLRNYQSASVIARIKLAWVGVDPGKIPKCQKQAVDRLLTKMAKKSGISEAEFKSLNQWSQDELDGMIGSNTLQFASTIYANKKFNEAASKFFSSYHWVLSPALANTLKDVVLPFSYKTQQVEPFEHAFKKIESLMDSNYKGPLLNRDKLSLGEIRLLESFARMDRIFAYFPSLENRSDEHMTKIWSLVTKVEDTREHLNAISTEIETEIKDRPVALIAYDWRNQAEYTGKKVNCFFRFVYKFILRSDVSHASIEIPQTDLAVPERMESHMWGKPSVYTYSRRSIGSHAFRTYSMNIDKIVSDPTTREKFQQLLGLSWVELLQKKYDQCAREYLSKETNFKHLTNPAWRRLKSWVKSEWELRNKPWTERMKFDESNQVICSEFAVKVLLHCLYQLNLDLAEDWKNKAHEGAAPQIEPPIRKQKTLHNILPKRLVGQLVRNGYVRKEERPAVIRRILKYSE